MHILNKIVLNKRLEVNRQQEAITLAQLKESEQIKRVPVSMSASISASTSGIIAEFKRKSPSKDWIHPEADPEIIIPEYEMNGASAVSVLTDNVFFGGTPGDLCKARKKVKLPLLRKEFIIDEYQIYQAKALGADAILLIAAILDKQTCKRFVDITHDLGMEVLLELHGKPELDYLETGADMTGINNRHLTSFETHVEHSFDMIGYLPTEKIAISESGIASPQTVKQLREAGYRGFLMGENFMKEEQPGRALQQFIAQL